jgi:hypothetical protein
LQSKEEITDITRTVDESQFQTPRLYVGSPLVAFTDVTSADALKLLCSLPKKSSPRDILFTPLLKSCADVFAPLIANLMNRSFAEVTFPKLLKTAQVIPLLNSGPRQSRQLSPDFKPKHYLQGQGKNGHAPTSAAPTVIKQFQPSSISLLRWILD